MSTLYYSCTVYEIHFKTIACHKKLVLFHTFLFLKNFKTNILKVQIINDTITLFHKLLASLKTTH